MELHLGDGKTAEGVVITVAWGATGYFGTNYLANDLRDRSMKREYENYNPNPGAYKERGFWDKLKN